MGIEIIIVLVALVALFALGGNDALQMRNTARNSGTRRGKQMQWLPALAFGGCVVPFAIVVFAFFIAIWAGVL